MVMLIYTILMVYTMSNYVKTCKYCKQEIKMSYDSGKWIHNKMEALMIAVPKQETSTYTLDAVVKNYHPSGSG